ncbi:MAG: hypothetical protein HY275_04050 [Gemmatimonadetes bacterium]|nr:hypothetical protein [Gemmatimonadota bacterium]
MHLHKVKLLRVVITASLQGEVVRILDAAGIRGYTVLNAGGAGAHGVRVAGDHERGNVVIEAVAAEGKAKDALEAVHRELFGPHAVIAYLLDAEVLRREKFL